METPFNLSGLNSPLLAAHPCESNPLKILRRLRRGNLFRRYVLQEKKHVDLTALAQAKQSIQELVQQEFQLTRSQIKPPGPGLNRKTAARFLEIGTGPVNAGSPFSSSKVPTTAGSEPAYSITAKDQLTDSATQNDAYHQATAIDESKQAEPLNFRPQTKPKQKEKEEEEEIKPSEWGGDYGLPRPNSRL